MGSFQWINLNLLLFAAVLSSVSADGVIGAVGASNRPGSNSNPTPANLELCPACATGCRTISGLFTRPQLPPGYSLVTQIPKGACRLIVAQLKNTKNFIALRNLNKTFILNGDPRDMGSNREVESSGTRFIYRRQETNTPETITATGPLSQPVDIMMVYNQPNPGIKYEFMLPVEQVVDHIAPPLLDGRNMKTPSLEDVTEHPKQHHTPHRHHNELTVETRRFEKPLTTLSQGDDSRPLRRRRRKFVWKINGMSACSKSCGGGVQHPQIICVREHNQALVIDRRCAGLERPRNQTVRCNTHSCPPYWGGTWSACSTTCGPGEQTRILECLQEITISLTVRVKDTSCNEVKPTTGRRCDLGPCESLDEDNELEQELPTTSSSQWITEPWSQCSVTCGSGQRTRSVNCNGRCRPEDRPPHLEPCFAPPCTSAHTAIPAIIHHSSHSHNFTPRPQTSATDNWWLVSEWTDQCSQQCGTGVQTRWVTCPTGECDSRAKPESSRSCSSDKQCGGRWFTGPWESCSEACGVSAKQIREVLCVVLVRGQARIVSDMTCPSHEKPVTEKSCDGVCLPRWFTGEWGPCEGLCPNGLQRREVRCLQYDGRYSTGCTSDMPVLKRNCHCSGVASNGLSTKTDYSSRESTQAQDEPLSDHHDCTDQFANCQLVVQARLCQYQYYKTSCCLSCRRNQQEGKE